jgi:plasmid stabilization system protein ParE
MGKIHLVKWTLIAAEEYEHTVDWLINNWNQDIAMRFVTDVENKIAILKKFPLLGNLSSKTPGCRKTLILPYHIMLYKVENDMLEIVRLFDTRQDPLKITHLDL